MPVYVLTDFTASASEHLTQALKSTGRATVVGAALALPLPTYRPML